ncbi:hypothetical protein FF1_015225 [Malus domestica]
MEKMSSTTWDLTLALNWSKQRIVVCTVHALAGAADAMQMGRIV